MDIGKTYRIDFIKTSPVEVFPSHNPTELYEPRPGEVAQTVYAELVRYDFAPLEGSADQEPCDQYFFEVAGEQDQELLVYSRGSDSFTAYLKARGLPGLCLAVNVHEANRKELGRFKIQ
ncbi:MAG: hypothetical protein HY514_00940 [Candidatus Aenigmarchaeota archaeon]|nr:hypothetical protein [Candidatus Aenigmarchaeota archaeon]